MDVTTDIVNISGVVLVGWPFDRLVDRADVYVWEKFERFVIRLEDHWTLSMWQISQSDPHPNSGLDWSRLEFIFHFKRVMSSIELLHRFNCVILDSCSFVDSNSDVWEEFERFVIRPYLCDRSPNLLFLVWTGQVWTFYSSLNAPCHLANY